MLGNISGDDTIFVAVRDSAAQRRLIRAMRRLSAAR
jgi:arginine repressor